MSDRSLIFAGIVVISAFILGFLVGVSERISHVPTEKQLVEARIGEYDSKTGEFRIVRPLK